MRGDLGIEKNAGTRTRNTTFLRKKGSMSQKN